MAALVLLPLTPDRVADAAALLAERHKRHRAFEPLLADAIDFRAQIERELERDGATGVVACRGNLVVGYLVGHVEADTGLGDTRAVVDLAGCAVSDAEVVSDLYAELGEEWVAQGCRRHQVLIPASEAELVDAWMRLAFGIQFITAVRETSPETPVDAGVTIRPGTRDDLPHLARLDRELWEHQARSPSFSGLEVPSQEEFEADWADTWDQPDTYWTFVAERGGQVVGEALLYRRPAGDLRVPERNVDLAHAATDLSVRGSGVGLALTAHVLRFAHDRRFRSMTIDWRSVNLLSSRFWPRRGFRPTFLRLYRHIP